jgi:hypothetical protein
MSAKNLPGGKGRPARKADNLTAICEPIVYKMWELDVSQPYGLPRPVTGIALPYLFVTAGTVASFHVLSDSFIHQSP